MLATPGCDVNVRPGGDDDVAAGVATTPVASAPTSAPIEARAKGRFRMTTTTNSSCNEKAYCIRGTRPARIRKSAIRS